MSWRHKIIDIVSYVTTEFIIEAEDQYDGYTKEYHITLTENDSQQHYRVKDDKGNIIGNNDAVAKMLIEICNKEHNK